MPKDRIPAYLKRVGADPDAQYLSDVLSEKQMQIFWEFSKNSPVSRAIGEPESAEEKEKRLVYNRSFVEKNPEIFALLPSTMYPDTGEFC